MVGGGCGNMEARELGAFVVFIINDNNTHFNTSRITIVRVRETMETPHPM